MVSHYELGQGHSWRPCQGPLPQVAVSLTGGGLDAPSGSWRALRGARLSGWFPVLLVCGFRGAVREVLMGPSLPLPNTQGVDTLKTKIFQKSFSNL